MSDLEDTMMEIPATLFSCMVSSSYKEFIFYLDLYWLSPLRFQENMKMRVRLSIENTDSKVEPSVTDIDG